MSEEEQQRAGWPRVKLDVGGQLATDHRLARATRRRRHEVAARLPPGPNGGTLDQHQSWEAAPGKLAGWWSAFEGYMAPVSAAMISEAAVGPGARVLDVATGFGEPGLSLARLAGTSGRVVASDLSPAMLAVAAQRAELMDLHNVDFVEMDAAQPTIGDTCFDAVVCRLGLMFVSDLDTCLRRLAGLLAPGGRLVAAVWGPAEANPSITLAARALSEVLGDHRAGDTSGIFNLGSHGLLDHAFTRAGLRAVKTQPIGLRLDWATAEDYAEYHHSGPLGRAMADVEPAIRTAAWEAVTAAAIRRCKPQGVSLPGEVIVVSGRRPAKSGPRRAVLDSLSGRLSDWAVFDRAAVGGEAGARHQGTAEAAALFVDDDHAPPKLSKMQSPEASRWLRDRHKASGSLQLAADQIPTIGRT